MSFLDLYQGDQDQAARMQPNEGTRLPSGFTENLHAAWSDGQLFSQSIARSNARATVLGDYIDEIRQKTGNDLSKEFIPDVAGGGQTGVTDFDTANARVAKLKESYPELDLAPLSDDEIDKRALAKSQAAHRTYQNLEAGEKTTGGSFGSFLGSAGSAAADPINIIALGIAPETGGASSILSAALRWGALAGVSQAAIEAASDTFKEQVQPGYMESGQPIKEIGGAFVGGAVLGGGFKALGNAWTRVKTGAWPTSVRDAGNVIESEANVASTNIFPGVAGEVAHREALVKTIDDILAGRPVDVGTQITPELTQAAVEAERAKIVPEPPSGLPAKQLDLPLEGDILPSEAVEDEIRETMAGAYMDMMPGQSALDVAIDSVKDEMAAGDTHAPGGASWKDVLSELQRRKRSGKDATINESGDFVPLQNPDEMQKTLAAPDHQDAIRADIDRELADRATGSQNTPRATFTTAKGSVYSAFEDETTIRNKAARPDVGHEGDSGIKDRSARTIYVDGDASVLSGAGLQGGTSGKGYRVAIKDGKATFLWWNDKEGKWGAPASGRDIPFTTKPEVGKSPVELWKPADDVPGHEAYRGQHAGNKITSVVEHPKPPTDIMVPGVDENGNHTMRSVNDAVEEVDAYKKLADDIQACAAPAQEAAE